MKYDWKRTVAAGLTLLCATAPLYACGSSQTPAAGNDTAASDSQTPSDPTYTPEEIKANNSVEKLLDHHSALSCIRTFTDSTGEATTIQSQYTMKDGYLQMNAVHKGSSGKATYYQQAAADETYGGAEYDQDADGQKYLALYSDIDSYNSVTGVWLFSATDEDKEVVDESSMQDGAVVITTHHEFPNDSEIYDKNMYYIDPESNDLLSAQFTCYDAKTDKVVSDTTAEITYDKTETFDVNPRDSILADSDYCEVNLITNPQQDDMSVLWYPVAHGTNVSFVLEDGVKLYSDEELTQELNASNIDISGEVRNIFVVKQ